MATMLLCGMLLHTASCAPPSQPAAEIRIGVIGPFSGPLAESFGDPIIEGTHLALSELEKSGGLEIAGRQVNVELVFEDSQDTPETAVEAVRRLINQEHVTALVGPCLSHNAIAVAAVAEKQGVPMVTPTATHSAVSAGRRFVFQVAAIGELQARALAQLATEDLHASSAAVLYDVTTAYNRDIAEAFQVAFKEAGGHTITETYTAGETDFRAPLERLRDAAPDVLLLPNYVDNVPLQVQQARELGFAATILGSDSWNSQLYARQEIFNNTFFTDNWHPGLKDPRSIDFVAKLKAAGTRELSSAAALAFDALNMLLHAIAVSDQLDAETLRQNLRAIHQFPGVTGPISYTTRNTPSRNVGIMKIDQGLVSFHRWIQPSHP